jgi:hypothetical protein
LEGFLVEVFKISEILKIKMQFQINCQGEQITTEKHVA